MSDVFIRREGRAGRITLTRAKALNALSHDMALQIDAALLDWQDNPEVAVVLLDAEGERAFCAGGDLAKIFHDAKDNAGVETRKFWRDEYEMNTRIAEYTKPVAVFMHGFVMGGGVGLAGHASHRIVGETAQVAMPECAIGLIPDVGGTHLLSRAPGALGPYLGITGARMGPADAIDVGFADTFVPEADWPALKADLVETGAIEVIVAREAALAKGSLSSAFDAIGEVFAGSDLTQIARRLDGAPGDWAEAARKAFMRNSPLAMHTTLALIGQAKGLRNLREALAWEFRAASRCLSAGDFVEGIRAQIIDKDRAPKWRHDALSDVTPDDVKAMLRPFEDGTPDFEEIGT